MSIDAVFNKLDNGTLEMIRNSRSAAAWIVVDSIQDMKINSLVEHLVSRASGLMTDQYVSYLLQKKISY